ncbi:endonuclease/exonuclease/phosphatase family protein [Nitrosomonas sp. ANs5]|uniref:endonuclease/exonuclease/phosphatase family protein n=1 Tax=Nitrosomonas sp. ANs5 TaxID=3423941 RepID=UPI003D33DF82
MPVTKVFSCDDRGTYFVREFGNRVFWFGERPETPNAGSFANCFFGKREGNRLIGDWFDIPKGRTRSSGVLRITVGTDDNSMSRTNEFPESGGFGGRNWQVTTYRPESEAFVPAYFEGSGIADLTGVWMGDDGGIYYIRHQGNDLVWFGELSGQFSNVFRCTIPSGLPDNIIIRNSFSGLWTDVPKGRTGGNGTLVFQIRDAFTLLRLSVTGGFGGTRWDRLMGVGSNVRLLTQNTMLMLARLAKQKVDIPNRTPILREMTRSFDIACLQEVMLAAPQKAFTGLTKIDFDQTRLHRVSSDSRHRQRETAQVVDARPNSKNTGIVVGKITNPVHPLSSRFYVLGPDNTRPLALGQDGALLLISKFPITAVSAFIFSNGRGSDNLASKGVLYAKIRMPGNKHIHVFNTHMQSGYETKDTEVRMQQLREFQQFMRNLRIDTTNEPIVFMGDINVIAPKPENWGSLAGVSPPLGRTVNTTNRVDSADYNEMLSLFPFLRDAWVSISGSRSPGFTYIGKEWINTAPNSPWGNLGNTLAGEVNTAPMRLDYMLISQSILPTSIALVPNAPPSPEPQYLFRIGTEIVRGQVRAIQLPSNTVSDHLGIEMAIRYPL